MRNVRHLSPMTLIMALTVALTLAGLVQAQSYTLERVEQDVFFQPDGTVRVEDTRALRLEGDFTGPTGNTYFVEIDPAPGGSVSFEGVEATDGGTPAEAEIDGNEIAWRVVGRDETRTFTFSYVLTGELEVATDAAQFDRQVLEPEHVPVDAYVLRLHPPAASPDEFRVFIFTDEGRIGTLTFDDAFSVATVELAPVSEDEWVRSRVLLDAANFTVQTTDEPRLEQWLQEIRGETQGFIDESERALEQGGFAPPPPAPSSVWLVAAWVGVAGVLGVLARSYTQFGREPRVAEVGPYYREPAEEIPPAAVPYVMTQSNPGLSAASPAVAATLLDFARRGYLMLETVQGEGFLGLGRKETIYYRLKAVPDNLTPFETDLWLVFQRAARRSEVPKLLGGLFESRQDTPNADASVFDSEDLRKQFAAQKSFAQSWPSKPRHWYEQAHGALLDPEASRQAGPVVALCFIAAVGLGVVGFVTLAWPAFGVTLLGAAGVLLLLGFVAMTSLKRWMPDKLLNAKRWEAYKRFLSDFSLMREAPAEHYKLWDYHFVYATALGVSKQYLKNLRELMRAEPDRFTTPLWLAHTTGPGQSSLSTVERMSASLNTLTQIETNLGNLQNALSSTSSTGGGFGGSSMGGSSGGGSRSGMR